MNTPIIAAFFDFDRTLLDDNSPKLGIRYQWDRGEVSLPYVLKVMCANWFYRRDLLSENRMARILLSYYRGRDLAPFAQGAEGYYHEVLKPHLAPNILACVQHHKAQGHVLVMVSAGVRYLLKPVARNLGFDHLICTDLMVGSDGLLTGESRGPVCSGIYKEKAVAGLSSRTGIDLGRSYAYGDHHSDVYLLEMVGNARAVEPTRQLREIAAEKGWPILTHR